MSYVYVLKNRRGKQVYTGYTNRPQHRIEAHRGERSGGAQTTKRWGPGNATMIILIGPFRDTELSTSKSAALSFEKKMKVARVGHGGVKGRILTLCKLLNSPNGRVTGKVNLCDYQGGQRLQIRCAFSRRTFLSHAKKANPEQSCPHVQFEWECYCPDLPIK